MRLLVVGNANSTYFVNFITSLKRYKSDINIDLLVTSGEKDKEKLSAIYNGFCNVLFFFNFHIPFLSRIPKVGGLVNKIHQFFLKKLLEQQHYDVICIHSLFNAEKKVANWNFFNNPMKVGVIWGSDFYKRIDTGTNVLFYDAASSCDLLCVSTINFKDDIIAAYSFPDSKFRQCVFGSKPLELLTKTTTDKNTAKKNLGIDSDLIVITCGYNSSPNQQHAEIIESFLRISDSLMKNVVLIFPFTYGSSEQYLKKISGLLEKSGLKYIVLDKYLKDEDIVNLRIGTDLLIQVQKTDANSASMQEHLYANNVVISGSWLPYSSLIEKGVYIEWINSIENLSEKLEYTLQNLADLQHKATTVNTPEKFSSSLWSQSIQDWYDMLNEYKTKI